MINTLFHSYYYYSTVTVDYSKAIILHNSLNESYGLNKSYCDHYIKYLALQFVEMLIHASMLMLINLHIFYAWQGKMCKLAVLFVHCPNDSFRKRYFRYVSRVDLWAQQQGQRPNDWCNCWLISMSLFSIISYLRVPSVLMFSRHWTPYSHCTAKIGFLESRFWIPYPRYEYSQILYYWI